MAMKPETEIQTLEKWLESAKRYTIMGSYPLGHVYLDERRDTSLGHQHVINDRIAAKRQPHMIGKYKHEVHDRIKELRDDAT